MEGIMAELQYEIRPNESINRWWITEPARTPFESPCETFEGEVNLGEAYVQIVYPVRKQFLRNLAIEKVSIYEGDYQRVYFPFENNRVDFTTFIHTPHHLAVYGKSFLMVEEQGKYPFEVYTCGGMKVWLNGEEVLCFTPYTRNIPSKTILELDLLPGENEIVVYADELAERDVFFYFEMRYKGELPLTGVLHVGEARHVQDVIDTEAFLKSCYFAQDCVHEGELTLCYDGALLHRDIQLIIENDADSAKLNNVDMNEVLSVTAVRTCNTASLGPIERFNTGIFKVRVIAEAGGFHIARDLVVGIIPSELRDIRPLPSIEERKVQALDFISQYGEQVVNRSMAILEIEKKMTDQAYAFIRSSLEMIKNKEDCADFYLVPMFLLITRYRHYLPDELYNEIKTDMLQFRYWIDEPGNDVMWYFSENHAFLFHISQYLAGHLFGEEQFIVSGRTGEEQYLLGKKRVEEWFDIFFRYGYAEWNSATYIPIDLIGFFVLYEMAPDENIKMLAKQALDFTFKIVSYNSFYGVMSSSFGRAYEDTLKARVLVEPSFLEWVSYGHGYVNFRSRAVSLYCLSSYVPPDYNQEVQLKEREWMSAELDQGLHQVKTYYYKTKDYFMACVKRFRPFEHGHQQHLMNVALGCRSVQYYVNHPGERPYSGGNRPSYWAGNGTMPFIEQVNNIMFMIFNIDPNELVHYIHAYCTFYEFDEYEVTDHWVIMRVEEAYLGTYFSNGVTVTNYGANTGKEVVSEGLYHGVIVKAGSEAEFGNFDLFKQHVLQMEIEYDGEKEIRCIDPQYGEIIVDGTGEGQVTVAGRLVEYREQRQMNVRKGLI